MGCTGSKADSQSDVQLKGGDAGAGDERARTAVSASDARRTSPAGKAEPPSEPYKPDAGPPGRPPAPVSTTMAIDDDDFTVRTRGRRTCLPSEQGASSGPPHRMQATGSLVGRPGYLNPSPMCRTKTPCCVVRLRSRPRATSWRSWTATRSIATGKTISLLLAAGDRSMARTAGPARHLSSSRRSRLPRPPATELGRPVLATQATQRTAQRSWGGWARSGCPAPQAVCPARRFTAWERCSRA
jgi:hypothetical protein